MRASDKEVLSVGESAYVGGKWSYVVQLGLGVQYTMSHLRSRHEREIEISRSMAAPSTRPESVSDNNVARGKQQNRTADGGLSQDCPKGVEFELEHVHFHSIKLTSVQWSPRSDIFTD